MPAATKFSRHRFEVYTCWEIHSRLFSTEIVAFTGRIVCRCIGAGVVLTAAATDDEVQYRPIPIQSGR